MLSEEDRSRLNNDLKLVKEIFEENRRNGIRRYALFLDFDGVIHVFYVQGTPEYEAAVKRMKSKMDFIDPDALSNVDEIVSMYDMDIIISSSWRYNGLEYCRNYLKKSGMKNSGRIIDTTQDEAFLDRRIEIAEYLIAHPVYSGFVVLDDIRMPEFKGSYIRIDPTKGFDSMALNNAKKVLDSTDQKISKKF